MSCQSILYCATLSCLQVQAFRQQEVQRLQVSVNDGSFNRWNILNFYVVEVSGTVKGSGIPA